MNGSPTAYPNHQPLSRPASAASRSATPSARSDRPETFSPTSSHSSSSPLPTMSDMTADILRVACLRGDLDDLPQRILHVASRIKLKTAATTTTTTTASSTSDPRSTTTTSDSDGLPGPTLLRLLFACLRTLGVDFDPALAALANSQVRRCTRCSASFRTAENTPTACVVPHAPPLVSYDVQMVADGVEPAETHYYVCCGRCALVFPGQDDAGAGARVGMCYVGPHVSVQDVNQHHADRDLPVHPQHIMRSPSVHVYGTGTGTGTGATSFPGSATRVGVEEGRSGPSSTALSRTAAWVNATALHPAVGQGRYIDAASPRENSAAMGSSSMSHKTASSTVSSGSVMAPVPTRVIQTIPWRQSSLYHPPGWVTIPPGLRRPGDSPFV